MTIDTLLDRMELFDEELEAASGEKDEQRGLDALNVAQDWFESVAATYPGLLGTSSTLTTSASTESSSWPASLLRLDSLWLLDATTSRPRYKLEPIHEVGGHRDTLPWPLQVTVVEGTGAPQRYWTDRNKFWWDPLPDATHTLRYYGLIRATDISVRGDTFAYDDILASPFAEFACRVLRTGRDDDTEGLEKLAVQLFGPAISMLQRFTREGPAPLHYTEYHTT